MFPNVSQDLIVEGLGDDDYVCVFRRDHPPRHGVSLDLFLAAKHILVKQALEQIGMVDAWMGLRDGQEIVVTVNASAEALTVAMNGDLVAAPRSMCSAPKRRTASPEAAALSPRPHPLQDGMARPHGPRSFDHLASQHRQGFGQAGICRCRPASGAGSRQAQAQPTTLGRPIRRRRSGRCGEVELAVSRGDEVR